MEITKENAPFLFGALEYTEFGKVVCARILLCDTYYVDLPIGWGEKELLAFESKIRKINSKALSTNSGACTIWGEGEWLSFEEAFDAYSEMYQEWVHHKMPEIPSNMKPASDAMFGKGDGLVSTVIPSKIGGGK